MDPYFNINNAGATNLTLGSNEIQEVSVVTNAYAGQYGQLSGAQVSYVTKAGTNNFHGNAQYWWNGRYLNANDFFNKWTTPPGTKNPAPFANANQWAGSVGGPIIKNKTFFFFDTEGLRFVLPNVIPTNIPTPQFAAAILNNIQNNANPDVASEFPTYQKLMNLFMSAPGASRAVPIAIGSEDKYCQAVVLAGFNPAANSCYAQFNATPTGLATEWIIAARVDQKLGDKDNLYGRFKIDHGLQPSYLDPINPNFDALSNQPSWDVQVNEAHIFGSTKTNVFTAAGSHYVAQFAQNHNLAFSTFPYDFVTSGPGTSVNLGGLTSTTVPAGFNPLHDFPQGRNITQYQFIDDFSWTHGRHTLRFGGNFRRYDVSDHNFFYNNPRTYFGYVSSGLQKFVDGRGYQYRQADNLANDVPVALWGLGLYAEDDWKVTPQFTLNLVLRAERNSNPVCQHNCFANFIGPLTSLPSANAANPLDVPYSQDIKFNQHQAFPGVDAVVLSPRIGFSWAPGKSRFSSGGGKTVITGGFGAFYDNPAVSIVDGPVGLLGNPPVSVTFRVKPTTGVLPFAPGPNGGAATWQAAATAFNINESFNQIQASLPAGVSFTPPAFTAVLGTMHAPRALEWNFQIQQQIGKSTAVSVNYVGNSVTRLPYTNEWPNAYDPGAGIFGGNVASVPSAPRDPIYGTVGQIQSGAISNYNGMNVTVTERFKSTVVAHFNYTFGHSLDEVSNGGINPYGYSSGQSIQTQINPTSLRAANYGNSDYDIRHLVSADFVVSPTFHAGNGFVRSLINGWQWSGKIYWRTGNPYSITDGNISGGLTNLPTTTPLLATVVAPNVQLGNCGKSFVLNPNAVAASVAPCLNPSAFFDTFNNFPTAFPNQTRNQYRGASYFDLDMGVFKNIAIKERVNLGIGLMTFNALNHANMPFPNNTFSTGDPTFGKILAGPGVGGPTSPYGNFLGFDSSPRIVQLSAKLVF